MNKEQVIKMLDEMENKYKDITITTEFGLAKIYYVFLAGQVGWEKHFDRFCKTEENFKQAKESILNDFGYLGRDSKITAIRKCRFLDNKETTVFKYSERCK